MSDSNDIRDGENKPNKESKSSTELNESQQNETTVRIDNPQEIEKEYSVFVHKKRLLTSWVYFNYNPPEKSFLNAGPDRRRNTPLWGYEGDQAPTIEPVGGLAIADKYTRSNFIKFTLSIVAIQLLLTTIFNAVVLNVESVETIFKLYNIYFMMISICGLLGLNFAFVCSYCTRTPPSNYICLLLSVIFMSLFSGCFTSYYSTSVVFYAFLTTTALVFVCIALACSGLDFTKRLIYMIVFILCLIVVSFIYSVVKIVTGQSMRIVDMTIIALMAVIECFIIIMELQMIFGGKTVEMNTDDYALGAFLLYMSIMNLFIKLVMLFGGMGTMGD